MQTVCVFITILPFLVAWTFCRPRLWVWWNRTGILGCLVLAIGVVVLRAVLFLEVPRMIGDQYLLYHSIPGSWPLVELPFLILGFKEVHLTYFVGSFFGYTPSSRELMAWHDGLIPFGITVEQPLRFCLANFVLVLGFFLIVFSFKKLIVLRGKSKTDLIGGMINK